MSRYRLEPTAEQVAAMDVYCAHNRVLWNVLVEQQGYFAKGHAAQPPNSTGRFRQLTEAREAFDWLAAGYCNGQQQLIRDFNQAMTNFFNGTHSKPTWRKRGDADGFRIVGKDFSIEKINRRWSRVNVPKVGWVKFRRSRDLPPGAKSCRITKDRSGRWHVAFGVKPEPIAAPGTGEIVGVDRGVVITAALSTGETLHCPTLSQREQARLRKAQRRAARAPKGSDAKADEYARIAALKAREADIRKDFVEKASTDLARSYDLIRFEKLNIVNMTASAAGTVEEPGTNVRQKAGLNRAILAQGWGVLRRRTEDKAPGRVEDVPAPFTSLRCSRCGWIEKKSRESQAVFCCVQCGFTCNADINAAQNVAAGQPVAKRAGRKARAGGTTPRERPESVREPQKAGRVPVLGILAL
jgi:transposase